MKKESITDIIKSIVAHCVEDGNDELKHYGTKYHSGRYPWGSGEDPYQHSGDLLSRIDNLKKQGLSEVQIAEALHIVNDKGEPSTSRLRIQKSLATYERRANLVASAKSLRDDGLNYSEIGRKLGINESTVRSLLNSDSEAKMNASKKTADFLKEQVDKYGMIDVGKGVEHQLGVSNGKLQNALYILELEGYEVYGGRVPQINNPEQQTTIKVLCKPGTEHKEIYDYSKVHSVQENYISYDNGESFKPAFTYPKSLDSSRLAVRYKEDGGSEKDGLIEIRRGVDDLSLGNSHYAQVRILVDDTHYLKGMAVYSDDLPDGVDVMFNTNKAKGTPVCGSKDNTVLKTIKSDPDNPFGALVKEHGGQSYYIDSTGKEQLSLINKTREEGDWEDWEDTLPSQFLGKQNLSMIQKQLKLTESDKVAEFDEIKSLTNPTIKRVLLGDFADDCDKAAEHLQAAALPNQKWHVILPVPSMKDTEIYAPQYEDGSKVALVRYPHAGTFEIPILTVNNKQPDAVKMISPSSIDAVGINSKVATRLSGADFDGDTVMLIPTTGNGKNNKINITSTPALRGLEGFDPKDAYPAQPGMRIMTRTNMEMGKISNLITDMTLQGASTEELTRAVKHSMVVIDAEKHHLNYRLSEQENGIKELAAKYQNGGGASTLLSRAKSQELVDERKQSYTIDPETGKKIYTYTGRTYSKAEVPGVSGKVNVVEKDGKNYYKDPTTNEYVELPATAKIITVTATSQSTKMMETDDAFTLVSTANTPQERAYASYANKMKALANEARLELLDTGRLTYSASAKQTYQEEVNHLTAQLNVSLMNAPRERRAQLLANSRALAKEQANPDLTKKEKKKIRQQELTRARQEVGAKRTTISISDREWEAIQAGAITDSKLTQILRFADQDQFKQRALPRQTTTLSTAKIAKIRAMNASGYTLEQMARSVGVSTSTIRKYINGEG
ncbi:MAG: helix-turn-helix domain-containing protein [Clostridia bacterium]|nr:helix-turn-helix domain-containing protein [Clostridia bacterium]